MDWTWYLFRFDGRINRALFWLALLIVLLLAGLLGLIGQAIHCPQRPKIVHLFARLPLRLSTTSSRWSIPGPIVCCRPPTARP